MKRRRDGSVSVRQAPWRRLAWTAIVAAILPSSATARSSMRVGNGTMTNITDVGHASCGFVSWPAMAETSYAAILDPPRPQDAGDNSVWTGTPSACGRCARVWCVDETLCPGAATVSATTPNSAVVYVVEDQRSRWVSRDHDLNLSPLVFQNLTGSMLGGRVPIQWRFVDCPPFETNTSDAGADPSPAPDPIGCAVCVHNDSNPYWLSLQPVNDTLGMSSVRVNGVRATRAAASPSFFFNVADPNGRLDMSSVEISITTRNHRKFTRFVDVQPGGCINVRRSDEVTLTNAPDGVVPGTLSPADDENSGIDDEETDDVSGVVSDLVGGNPGVIGVPPAQPAPPNSPKASLTPVLVPVTVPPSLTPAMTPHQPPLIRPPLTGPPPSPPVASATAAPSPSVVTHTPSTSATQPLPTMTPPPMDKTGALPTTAPAHPGHIGSDSDSGTPRKPRPPTPVEPSSSPPVVSPQPTIGRTPVGQLSGGVLTNPVFIGLLLGTVGLVGAIVAYRAKARQGQRLALVPPETTSVVAAVMTTRAGLSPRRTDFASL